MTAPRPVPDALQATTPIPRVAATGLPRATSMPRTTLRAAFVLAGIVLLAVLLLAGCGSAPLPAAAPVPMPTPTPVTPSPAPTTTEPPTSDPTGTSGTSDGGRPGPDRRIVPPAPRDTAPHRDAAPRPAALIWPVHDAPAAANLQREVDGGAQPWLLDPVEVATSYVGVELGYRNPSLSPVRPGLVEVRDGRTPGRATVTLDQPVRHGDGGIWVVTGVQRS